MESARLAPLHVGLWSIVLANGINPFGPITCGPLEYCPGQWNQPVWPHYMWASGVLSWPMESARLAPLHVGLWSIVLANGISPFGPITCGPLEYCPGQWNQPVWPHYMWASGVLSWPMESARLAPLHVGLWSIVLANGISPFGPITCGPLEYCPGQWNQPVWPHYMWASGVLSWPMESARLAPLHVGLWSIVLANGISPFGPITCGPLEYCPGQWNQPVWPHYIERRQQNKTSENPELWRRSLSSQFCKRQIHRDRGSARHSKLHQIHRDRGSARHSKLHQIHRDRGSARHSKLHQIHRDRGSARHSKLHQIHRDRGSARHSKLHQIHRDRGSARHSKLHQIHRDRGSARHSKLHQIHRD
ncbi:hypothetical protein ACOMHN_036546 [Nucella lapillus]